MLIKSILKQERKVKSPITRYCFSRFIPKSIIKPLEIGPRADANTIKEVAIDLTEPRCFVPKNSGQKAPETVAPKPCINPKHTKQRPALNRVSAFAAMINPTPMGIK